MEQHGANFQKTLLTSVSPWSWLSHHEFVPFEEYVETFYIAREGDMNREKIGSLTEFATFARAQWRMVHNLRAEYLVRDNQK